MEKYKNLLLRMISALVLIPLVVGVFYLGDVYYITAVLVLSILMSFEWQQLTVKKSPWWKLFGLLYILVPCLSMLIIAEYNMEAVFHLLILVWATDVGGYAFGKLIRGPKLLPQVSPNKTWAGLLGAIVFAMACGYFIEKSIYICAIIAVLAQIGDLFESWMKRLCNADKSGELIPGHGGILDRVDGYVFVITIQMILMFFNKSFF